VNKTDLYNRAIDIIADVLAVDKDKVSPEAQFEENLSADSLDYATMISAFEEEFGIKISDEELQNIKSVSEVLHILSEKLGIQD